MPFLTEHDETRALVEELRTWTSRFAPAVRRNIPLGTGIDYDPVTHADEVAMDDTAVPSQAVVATWQKLPLLVARYYYRPESAVLGALRLLNAQSWGHTEVRNELMCQFVRHPRLSGLSDEVDLLTPQVERNTGIRPAAHGDRYVILPVPDGGDRASTRPG